MQERQPSVHKLSKLILSLTLVVTIIATLTTANAQDLVKFLPADSIVVVGAVNLNEIEDRGSNLMDAFMHLEVAELFTDVSVDEVSQFELNLQDDIKAMFGQEVWLSLSLPNSIPSNISSSTPSSASSGDLIPQFALIGRLSSEFITKLETDLLQEESLACTENNESFYQRAFDNDPNAPMTSMNLAIKDSVYVFSFDPRRVCSILGTMSGANNDSIVNNPRFKNSLGKLGQGNVYTYFDPSTLVDTYAHLGMGQGFDNLINRLQQALATAGIGATVSRFTDDGIVTEGWQLLDSSGGDKSIYRLLSNTSPVSPTSLQFAPIDSLSYNNSATNLRGWWAYINELALEVPALAWNANSGNLDSLIEIYLGIDVSESLFSWMGNSVTTISTAISDVDIVNEQGIPSDNLLGENVYIIQATDEAKARTGLRETLDATWIALAMADGPTTGPSNPSEREQLIAGQVVNSMEMTEGTSVHYAVVNGHVLIATSLKSMTVVLETYANGASLANNQGYVDQLNTMPNNVRSLSVSDLATTVQSITSQSTQQRAYQPNTLPEVDGLNGLGSNGLGLNGLGGASTLALSALVGSSPPLTEFTEFIASRLGFSVGYTQVHTDGIYSYSETQVQW